MHESKIENKHGESLDFSFHAGDKLNTFVVIGHGVTANKDRELLVALAEGLADRGWPCLRFSFSGNGSSGGKFEESTISKEMEDLDAILKTIPQEKHVAYIGHSMGGAVGVKKAGTCLSIRCLVSLAGLTHSAEFVDREFGDVVPGEGCMWEDEGCPLSQDFVDDLRGIENTLDAAAKVFQPWLLIHGEADDVVPIKDSEDAYAAARCEKKLIRIPDAGHMFGKESYRSIVEAIDEWLAKSMG